MVATGPTAKSYPTEEQYQDWKEHAARLDTSISVFIAQMVEAGRKKFTPEVEPDETRMELREQRADLKRELERTRKRVESLEDRLMQTEERAIIEFVSKNPGCTWDQIIQKLKESTDERGLRHLDAMEGDTLRRGPDEGFYLVENGQ